MCSAFCDKNQYLHLLIIHLLDVILLCLCLEVAYLSALTHLYGCGCAQ